MTVHIGTSGWSYGHRDGFLYPPATPPRDRLQNYVRRFSTVELNDGEGNGVRDADTLRSLLG